MTPTEKQKAAALEALQELHDDCKDNGTWYLKRTMLIRNYILQPTAPGETIDGAIKTLIRAAQSQNKNGEKE